MVPVNDSQTCQQFSARNSSYLDRMALPHLDKNYGLPYFPLPKHTPSVAFPGQSSAILPGLNIAQREAVGGFLKDSQYGPSNGLGFTDKLLDASQKRFLIFDQSGDHTRLFFSPSFSPSANGPSKEVVTRVDDQFLMKPIVEEKWDENHLSDGEGEMLEDTEEINALLYSDSDDDEYNDNDEVTSTRHSLFSLEEDYKKDHKLLNYELSEQVASSDDTPKRQRLLDGKYKKSSLESAATSPAKQAISCSYEDDVESSCAGYKRQHKVNIRQALKILETIIPGSEYSNDPLSILDKAVAYLKSMKTEAESLGLS